MASLRSLCRSTCTVSLTIVGLVALASPTEAESIRAITSTNVLISFDSATPGVLSSQVGVTGLQAGEVILGIDLRPANGLLYALGSSNSLYTIDPTNGFASLVGSLGMSLTGPSFGFDFNPVTDRIRITSAVGENLRLNPNTGAAVATDTPLNPGSPRVIGSAYTNNFSGAVTTTLYDIDSAIDSLLIQNSNAGTLTSVGGLGINFIDLAGFDISGTTGIAYAALNGISGPSSLYTINLTTGAASLVGTIGSNGVTVTALAAPIGLAGSDPVPEPASLVLIAAGLAGGARRWRATRHRQRDSDLLE